MSERSVEQEQQFQINFSSWIGEAFAASSLVNKLMAQTRVNRRTVTAIEADVLTRTILTQTVNYSLGEQATARAFGNRVVANAQAPRVDSDDIQTAWRMLKGYGIDKARELQLTTEFQSKYGVDADTAEVILSDIWSNSGPALAPAEMVGSNY